MYNDGLGAAIVIGLVAFALPMVWMAWWLFASLGEPGSPSRSIRPQV